MSVNILIVYYSIHGGTLAMAQEIAQGVQSHSHAQFILRTVPKVTTGLEESVSKIPEFGAPYVDKEDLKNCDALIIGSPTRFGNMAASMKYFIDGLSQEWFNGTFIGKPAGVFTSAASLHGGHEATLLSMMLPLLHHGMLLVGLPYTEVDLLHTKTGGTPYGPSHLAGPDSNFGLSEHEVRLCRAYGARIARIAVQLKEHL